MADLLQAGETLLTTVRKASVSVEVEYRRSGAEPVTVSATIGATRTEQAQADGVVTEHNVRDYLILAEDLVIDGSLSTPMKGDKIAQDSGTFYDLFEVLPIGDAPEYELSGPYRKTYRIHTKHVGTEVIE